MVLNSTITFGYTNIKSDRGMTSLWASVFLVNLISKKNKNKKKVSAATMAVKLSHSLINF